MTELILVRHGETDYNREHRFQGQIDVPLNERGREQAQRLAERLAAEPITTIYCSDLARARQTAAPLAARLGLDLVTLPTLREQCFGVLEGKCLDEVLAEHPALWAQWCRHDADYALPGGESVRTFHARVCTALGEIAPRHDGQKVAVVTHGGALDMIHRMVTGRPLHGPRECAIPNCGLNRLRASGAAYEILHWADDAHVAELDCIHPLDQALLAAR